VPVEGDVVRHPFADNNISLELIRLCFGEKNSNPVWGKVEGVDIDFITTVRSMTFRERKKPFVYSGTLH
jgi:hypothetical protein